MTPAFVCRTSIIGVAVASAMALFAAPAWAVHDIGAVELDGNILNDGAAGTDWDEIAAGGALSDVDTDCTFVTTTGLLLDPAPQSIFHTGGSKDTNDIPQWKHKDGNVPDKNDMTHGIAAAFICDDELIIYMAGLRFANDGDSNIGGWFTAEDTSPKADGTFNGQHTDTDLFVTAGFSNGGTVVNVGVFGWDTATNSLVTLVDPDTNAAKCDGGAGDVTCAIANESETAIPVPALWNYTPKSGAANTAPQNSFFELGIRADEFVNDACFTSFLLETRSSTSPTAQLKDFIFGDFDICGISVTLICELFEDGIAADFSGFEYVLRGDVFSAFGTIASASVFIDVNRDTSLNGGLSNDSDDVLLDNVANILESGTPWQHSTDSPNTPPWESPDNPDTFEVYAVATVLGTTVISDLSDPDAVDACPPVQVTTELVITKECITCLFDNGDAGTDDVIAIEVRVAGTVTNNSTVPVDNVIVTDSDAGSQNIGTIGVGATVSYFFDYVPTSVNSVDPDKAEFTNTVSATGTPDLVGGSVTSNTGSDTCELCLGTEDRTLGGQLCSQAWPPPS